MKSAPAIAFDYTPSRRLAAALAGVVLLAIVAIAFCGLVVRLKAVLVIATGAYAAWSLRDFLHPPFGHIAWHAAGHWRVRDRAGNERAAEVVHASVRGALIVLVLRVGPKRKIALPLFTDNCAAETHRQLRIRLATIKPA